MSDTFTRAQFLDRLQERSEHLNDLVDAGITQFLREQGVDISHEEEVSSRLIGQALGPDQDVLNNPLVKYIRATMRIYLHAALDIVYGPDH